jgi:hypothetical protein
MEEFESEPEDIIRPESFKQRAEKEKERQKLAEMIKKLRVHADKTERKRQESSREDRST